MIEEQYQQILSAFKSKNVLVIGDLILDVFLKGSSTRLCPEAPVPIVDVSSRLACIGGAGNTAENLKLLGAQVTFCTVVGNDDAGREALSLMQGFHLSDESIIRHPARGTIVKTRVVAGTQVITRFDSGTTDVLDDEASLVLALFLEEHYESFDAIIISDYDKGIVSPSLLRAILKLQYQHNKFIAVDSKRLGYFKSLSPTLVKPNYDEAIKLLKIVPCSDDRVNQMMMQGEKLKELTGAATIALTVDRDGSIIFENGLPTYHAKAPSKTTPQVAGAGDVYLSAFTLAQVTNGVTSLSADLATSAAALAISKDSTATCSARELRYHFSMHAKYIDNIYDLRDIAEAYRLEGKRIVFTNGCFDILHSGHVTYLSGAKALGDILIVGVNTDESIKRLKGNSRPINELPDRLRVLSSLADVDHVVTFGNTADNDKPINLIEIIRPHLFVKGGDYNREDLPEGQALESIGAEIVILPRVADQSTTNIIQRIYKPVTELASLHEPMEKL